MVHYANCIGTLSVVVPLALVGCAGAAEPIPGIGPAGEIQRLHTGFGFTEGPADDGHGNLYFSDIPNATIRRVAADGQLTVFTDQSNRANGLMFSRTGELIACEMSGRLVAWDVEAKTRRVLAEEYGGKPFNAPNDLVLDSHGGVYFTDPAFGAPQPPPQGTMGVYYYDGKGNVTRVAEDLPAPNGILLSPDERTLYLLPSGEPTMWAYEVTEPGKLGRRTEFCRLAGRGQFSGADGATLDTQGNLYITSQLGIQVFDSAGKALGVIELPEQPANVTFGGPDRKTLYVTARTSLYAAPMQVAGHRFGQPRVEP